jgi:molecular chaperone IbpA
MTTTRRFNTDLLNDPFFIGFDGILNKMHEINRNVPNYPPYNLIKTGDDSYLIELAVAGFDEDDFDIELHQGVLTIRAEVGDSDLSTNYIHKGIAARSFERKFTLADTIEVEGVSLHQGMLTVRLQNVIPDEKKPKKIPIGRQLDPELLTE